jgi:hypothetical protein
MTFWLGQPTKMEVFLSSIHRWLEKKTTNERFFVSEYDGILARVHQQIGWR